MEERVAEFRDMYPTLPMNASHFTSWQQNSRSFQSMAVMDEGMRCRWASGGAPQKIGVLERDAGNLFRS
jgi:hypothetical protein